FEYGVFPQLLERNEPFYAYVWRGYWRDIGTPSSYLEANLDVISGRVKVLEPLPVERGEKFDASAEIQPPSVVDPSCTLKAGAQIVNSVVSRNCYIEERARIQDSVLRAGTRIGAGSTVQGAVIGKGCYVGHAVEVGRGAVLGDKSVITDYSQIGQ
ncbi:MAG: sugar phosphate nucleotidyltransferase, partial [Blastocatellia bacterium]